MAWGHGPSRARLSDRREPGHAAWFRLPLLRGVPAPQAADPRPGHAILGLAEFLRSRGIDHLYPNVHAAQAVLSVCRGLTVWCRNGFFQWSPPGGVAPEQHPVRNLVEVTERLVSAFEVVRCGAPAR
jgi:hypothetical protein